MRELPGSGLFDRKASFNSSRYARWVATPAGRKWTARDLELIPAGIGIA